MSLSIDQIQVASFETVSQYVPALQPYTAPEPNCYSPLCIPTALQEQCPDTGGTVVTIATVEN
ncbi:MAG TPA: hypothetical protein VEX86_06515 [Longimicrobium sp.]|nr:hypothetical protein [Longimicrobium sp.]